MHINMKILFLVLTCALFRAALCDEDSLQEPISENENIEAEETNTSNEDNENDGGVPDVEAVPVPQESENTPKGENIPKDVEVGQRSIPIGAGGAKRSGNYIDYTNWDSLTSRYAPDMQSQRGGIPYVVTEQRLKEIRSQFMYWYFDMGGNADNEGDYQKYIQSSNPAVHKNLNFQLPFFGFRYNYTRVSINGYLEFSDPPPTYPSYPLVFPNKDWPKENDPAFIGIFFSKCRTGNVRSDDVDQRKPGVYFRLERDLQTRTDVLGMEVRERLKWDIRTGVIGAETFDPKHAILVTWKNVTFAGGISQSTYKTNTFQMVLATDEVFTYAIFNYLDMQWTSHTEAGGDTTTGENGVAAFVGFNAGNGTRSFEYKPYSQGTVIRDLTGRGWANGFPGRHIFRIDENILLGTCNKDVDGANLPLMFAPESGNMLGGTVVNITGPCFIPNQKITCTFDTEQVEGIYIDKNRAACVQPQLFVEGYIRFEIALGNEKFKWKGKYFIETPATAAEKIFFFDDSVYEKSPAEIKITWVKQNLTNNDGANVRLSLWGYRERTIKPEFVYIDKLGDSQNNGEYVISPAAFKNRENEYFQDIQFGFIQINLTDSIPVGDSTQGQTKAITPVIWSRPVPLGWYFGPQWERQYGKKWPRALCDNWLKNDRYLKNFAHELPQCPCTLRHALTDKGRYLPDFDCDKDANPKCQYHKGALHCVKTGSPTLDGSEQQCCYDKNGYLMLSYDQQWGSSPRRSHNLGFLPWNEANKVPTLSQWFHDMVPRFLCCMWQEEQAVGCETLRFERRPTQDCVAYQAPGLAGVFGDPHIVTFDNTEYTFNGKGEFCLLRTNTKSNRMDVQGRFEQLPMNAYGEVKATQLTSVTARGNSSTVLEVRLRPREARWRYRLDVIADGKRIYFDRPSLKFQHFPGVTVYTPTYILNQSEVIMMFDSGAGVEVVENEGYMTARVYLPWTFINQTRGLFGNWSFDQIDDFTNPDGSIISPDTNFNDFERIYTDFGMKWLLEDKDDPLKGASLFFREHGRTSSTYNNKTFKPEFRVKPEDIIPANRSIDIQKANEYCFDNYQCQYDYAVSLNRDLSHFTLNYLATIKNIKEINSKRQISCGVLETPRFGRKSTFLFIPGTKVLFECNQNFILIGDQRRECLANGRWDASVYGYTECLRQQEYSSRTAGITSAIVLAIIIPIIVILAYIGFLIYKKYYKDKQDEEEFDQDWDTKPKHWSGSELPKYEIPASPLSDKEFTFRSPSSSMRSSTSSTSKKRRSYEKSYRTHEPLEGLPETDFEDKKWDLDPTPPSSPSDLQTKNADEQLYSPSPDLIKVHPTDSNLSDIKKKENYLTSPYRSQSSIITDV